jgi:hypothetical protein
MYFKQQIKTIREAAMIRFMQMLTGLFLLFTATLSFAAVYDDFSADTLQREKWQYLDTGKHLAGGELLMDIRAFDQQFLANSLSFTRPDLIDSISADFNITEVEHYNHSPGAFLAAGLEGSFLACDNVSCSGDIVAGLYVMHDTPGAATASIYYHVFLDGFGGTELVSGTLTGIADINHPMTLIIRSDASERIEFIFSGRVAGSDTPVELTYEFNQTSDGTIGSHFKRILVGEGGSVGNTGGLIRSSIDNVQTATAGGGTYGTLALYDDFSGDNFDSTKWQAGSNDLTGFCRRAVENGRMLLEAEHDGTASTPRFQFSTPLPENQFTEYFQADVTIDPSSSFSGTAPQGNHGELQLEAFWFNDTYNSNYNGDEGLVVSRLRVNSIPDGTSSVEALAFRCNDQNCSTDTPIFYQPLNCSVVPGQPNTLSMKRAGRTYYFACDDDEVQHSFSGNIYEHNFDVRRFRLRAYAENGETTFYKTYIDNVYTSGDFFWPLFLPAIQAQHVTR